MDPTARLLELLALLQARPDWSSTELAARLGTTPRTVRRDISRLRSLGYRVESEPGPLGGYRLAAGQALPPLVLSDDEAVALALGLRAAAAGPVPGLEEAAITAIAKLEQGLPSRVSDRVRALSAAVVPLARRAEGGVDPEILVGVAMACRRAERLRIAYEDSRGARTNRDIDPYRLVQTARRWYLVARDVRRQAWRTLRVDRIERILPLGVRARLSDPPDARALVAESVATGPYRWRAVVRLGIPPDVATRLISPTTGIVEPDEDGTRLRLGADDLGWLARYLVGLCCPLEVIEPPELAEALRALGRQLAATPDPAPTARPAAEAGTVPADGRAPG